MAPSYAVSNPNELACVQPNPWEDFLQESPIQPQALQTSAAPLDGQSYFTLANKGESGASAEFRRSITSRIFSNSGAEGASESSLFSARPSALARHSGFGDFLSSVVAVGGLFGILSMLSGCGGTDEEIKPAPTVPCTPQEDWDYTTDAPKNAGSGGGGEGGAGGASGDPREKPWVCPDDNYQDPNPGGGCDDLGNCWGPGDPSPNPD